MAEEKTNVARLLDQKKVPYTPRQFDVSDGVLDAETAAARLGISPETCFKTLVTVGASGKYYVFIVPGPRELDLKAAARAAGEKSIAMLPQARLLPLTGYVHGGCSPIGMKKRFPTFLDELARGLPQITVSAGKVGHQVSLAPQDLADMAGARFAAVSRERG